MTSRALGAASRGDMKRFACAICALLAIGSAHAAGGSVSGMVVDRDGPVVGAVVALIISEAGPAPKAVMTGADGRYSFDAVAAGRYNVSASFAGSDPVASAPFAVADGGAIEVAPLSVEVETIEVNAKTDEVPVRGNTTTGETFQASKLEYIPTARSYTEVLKIAPGVSEDTSGGNLDGSGGDLGLRLLGPRVLVHHRRRQHDVDRYRPPLHEHQLRPHRQDRGQDGRVQRRVRRRTRGGRQRHHQDRQQQLRRDVQPPVLLRSSGVRTGDERSGNGTASSRRPRDLGDAWEGRSSRTRRTSSRPSRRASTRASRSSATWTF